MNLMELYYKIFKAKKIEKSRRKIRQKAPHILKNKTTKPEHIEKIPYIVHKIPPKEALFIAELIDTYEMLHGVYGQETLAETLHKKISQYTKEYIAE